MKFLIITYRIPIWENSNIARTVKQYIPTKTFLNLFPSDRLQLNTNNGINYTETSSSSKRNQLSLTFTIVT